MKSTCYRYLEVDISIAGQGIEGALEMLGVDGVAASVGQGVRHRTIRLDKPGRGGVEGRRDKLLANTVIENYRVELVG